MKPVDLIVAMDDHNGIGKNGDLPWHLPPDLKHFRDVTSKTESEESRNAVVMGRKTWESIPDKFRPLPNRLNVVLSRNGELILPDNALLLAQIDAIGSELSHLSDTMETIFIIGGAQIYHAALEKLPCRRIYVTRVRGDFECDAFFPTIPDSFELVHEDSERQYETLSYTFQLYQSTSP